MRIEEKRKAASKLGRAGVAEMIQGYVNEYLEDSSCKSAVKLSGQLHVMADSCTFDVYWEEKMLDGKCQAEFQLANKGD